MDNVDKYKKSLCFQRFLVVKKSTFKGDKYPPLSVDNVDNYLPKIDSPISTTFPAPIVINRSPFTQFFNKNFSISSNEGK